jgi:DNA-binding transcriptional ArsR family regulator
MLAPEPADGYTGIMTQLSQRPPASPRAAARRRDELSRLLDPDLFKALADPTRLRLLACLARCARPCSVTEVAQCCDVDFSVVARHLATLARAGVLSSTKRGRTVWYALRADDLADHLRELADALESRAPCGDAGCCPSEEPARARR